MKLQHWLVVLIVVSVFVIGGSILVYGLPFFEVDADIDEAQISSSMADDCAALGIVEGSLCSCGGGECDKCVADGTGDQQKACTYKCKDKNNDGLYHKHNPKTCNSGSCDNDGTCKGINSLSTGNSVLFRP